MADAWNCAFAFLLVWSPWPSSGMRPTFKRAALAKSARKSRRARPGKNPGSRVFSCLENLLASQARSASDRVAILAPGRSPMTYGTLWARTKETVHRLRELGVGRRDRVAVVLPDGPEAAVTMISVAAGAVCVPLNPAFTAD